jgi:hypothetical protein
MYMLNGIDLAIGGQGSGGKNPSKRTPKTNKNTKNSGD